MNSTDFYNLTHITEILKHNEAEIVSFHPYFSLAVIFRLLS